MSRSRPRSFATVPQSTVLSFTRVEKIQVLRLTISRKFSVSQPVNDLLAGCSQSLFALRIFRQRGLPADTLQVVFQAIVSNKLSYGSPAWWGFSPADHQSRLETFLQRSVKFGHRTTTFPSICDDADKRRFTRIAHNTRHLQHQLLLPRRNSQNGTGFVRN